MILILLFIALTFYLKITRTNRIKDIIEEYLDSNEAEEFALFVWGKDFKNSILISSQSVDLWNSKMGHKLELSYEGNPWKDFPKMIEVWKNERKRLDIKENGENQE